MKPGIYSGVSFDAYKAWNAVNNSLLKYFAFKSPAHAKWYLDNGRPETEALAFGSAVDCYLLEPSRFAVEYHVAPKCDKRTKEGKAIWAEFSATLREGQQVIDEEQMAAIQAIYAAVKDSQAMRLIQGGKAQECLVWEDKETGLLCKARLDYLQSDFPIITDVKTTRDCSPHEFAGDIYKYGYYQQAAFYAMGYEALTGRSPFIAIFAIEKEPPYVAAAYQIGERTIEAGKIAARAALKQYAKCMAENSWPPYSPKITMLEMSGWALQRCGVHTFNL